MKKTSVYRTMIVMTLAALIVLLAVQVYWFTKAYAIQERQFDHTVSLALRNVADKLLKLRGEHRQRIQPITQTASNTFLVKYAATVSYEQLDSLVRKEFEVHGIYAPFELIVSDHTKNVMLYGNFYYKGALTPEAATCRRREPTTASADFSVTFPGKKADIVGAMSAWIFTAILCIIILIVFAFLLIDLSKQKKLAEMKADFINNMTHELQTPVANIAMASEVLTKISASADKSRVMQYAGIIHQENQRLRFHIEQVLQTAQLDRGEVEMRKQQIDLNDLINEVTRIFEVRLEPRQGRIQKNLKASHTMVEADPAHIAQVFYNLLDNADKYSHDKPEITISTRDHEHGILVSVADRGIGIRKEVQRFIFDKFYRAPAGNRHDVKGFGLGLAYVHHVMTAHAGTVNVSSEENKGSRFDLYFQTQ